MPERRAEWESAAWVQATTRAIARGDRDALGQFYEAWFNPCYAMARSLTGRDESFCLDVVQETMLRVIRSMREIQSSPALHAWMKRAVHSAALDLLRREARRLRREHLRGASQERAAAADDRIAWVAARLAELPAGDGALVSLRLARGQTLESAGAATGLTGDAAHGRIRRALAKLKRWAREGGHE